jgi:SPP1 gp7 family putative phage head morphogenesis protein
VNLKALRDECREIVRKADEADTEAWLKAGLPRGHGLPPTNVMAGLMVDLKEAVAQALATQRDLYVAYIRANHPQLAPVSKEAVRDLPAQAAVTYHAWIEGVTLRREWWNEKTRSIQVDTRQLASSLQDSLEEAIGTGAVAATRSAGAYAPGFAPLTQSQAKALLKEIGPYKASRSIEARAIYQAVADRAVSLSVRAAVLRDGAGRLLAAVSYTAGKEALEVAHMGALEAQVPGTGVQLVRELAALAAKDGRGIALQAPAAARPFFTGLGFAAETKGRYSLAAPTASTLAQSPPALGPTWTRVGWLEGPEATLSTLDKTAAKTVATQVADWGGVRALMAENMTAATGEGTVVVLTSGDGKVLAIAQYHLPADGNLMVDSVAVSPSASAGTGRRMMRELSAIAAAKERGVTIGKPTATARGFYQRIGMSVSGPSLVFDVTETAAFATGLTGSTAFGGQISWDLAVAGASDWLREQTIKGVVDQVTATTHKALVDTLADGLDKGQSVQEIASRVQHLDSTFGPARAERISRNEVITATRAGNHQAAKDAGSQDHEWRSRQDSRVRQWHADAHGQRQPIDKPFLVKNADGISEKLMYPGDRSLGATASNTVLCRCSVRNIKIGVTDDPALGIDQHGLAKVKRAPGQVVAGT